MNTKASLPPAMALLIALSLCSGCISNRTVEQLQLRYVNDESAFLLVDGMNVHYRMAGPDYAPTVLLLHDMGHSLQQMAALADTLVETHRVVSLDLPGFGLTGPHPQHDYSTEAYRDFLDAFLSELGIDRCYVVGAGLGGRLAWELAITYPKRVRRMALISPDGFQPYEQPRTLLEEQLRASPLQRLWFKRITPKRTLKRSFALEYPISKAQPQATFEQRLELLRREGNRTAFVKRTLQEDYNRTNRLNDLEVPSLILWGTEDHINPITHAAYFHKLLQGSEVRLFKDLGHNLLEESFPEVAGALMAFLAY